MKQVFPLCLQKHCIHVSVCVFVCVYVYIYSSLIYAALKLKCQIVGLTMAYVILGMCFIKGKETLPSDVGVIVIG